MTDTLNIVFNKVRWRAEIFEQALVGFEARMGKSESPAEVTSLDVSGAFEMPRWPRSSGRANSMTRCLPARVADGGIYRHDFVAAALVGGLMQAQLETGVPTNSVSLIPHHF